MSHRTCGSSPPCTRHPIHAFAPVCCVVVVFSSTVSVLYFVPPLSFQPFQMSSSKFHEKFRSNPLCDFRLGTVATSDHETPLTQPLRWIQGNMRIGLVLEVTTSFQHFKYGIVIRIWSVNQDSFSICGQNILWNDQICGRFKSRQYRNSSRSTRRASTTNKHEGCCSQIKGKNKTTKEGTC